MSVEPGALLQTCTSCGAQFEASEFQPLAEVLCPHCGSLNVVGRLVGEFELLEVLGRGGMGVVYRAQDTQLNRPIALKLLRRDHVQEGYFSELEAEASVTASINHPHVVKVFTTGTAAGRFYLAMELVDCGTLERLMEVQGRVAETQALEIASQIAQGLRAAHQHGLIHRDVKPGNILFSDNHTAKIVDFGLAIMEEAAHGTGEIWGTPYYVSPERLDQKAEDFRSDIYSLGATIFHALAGRPPFEAEDASMVAVKHLKNQAVSLQAFAPWVSGRTAYIINRTLLKDPADRYQSYDELIEHLEYARSEVLAEAAQPQPKKRVVLETAADRKREGFLTSVMIAVVGALLVGGGLFFYYAQSAPRAAGLPGTAVHGVQASGGSASRFEAARQLLLGHRAPDAAEQFHRLAEEDSAQPFSSWMRVHEGMAWLAAGEGAKAQAAFEQLRARSYTGSEAQSRLGKFFAEVAALGAAPTPVAAGNLRELDAASWPALEFLMAGMKDWGLGELEEGSALLRQYLAAAPVGPHAWLADYRELAADYLADYSNYRSAVQAAENIRTTADLQAATAALEKVQRELKHPVGPLAEKLNVARKEIAAAGAERVRKAAEQFEVDKKALAAARTRAAEQAQQWDFAEARRTIQALHPAQPDLLREQRALLTKIEWLTQFRSLLQHDLAAGFSGVVKTKDGRSVEGGIVKATEAGVQPAGEPAPPLLKWPELAPASLLEMAESFAQQKGAMPDAVQRHWYMGAYAVFAGQRSDLRKLLQEGAKSRPEFGDQLPYLMAARTRNLSLKKQVAVSDPASTGVAAAVDGNPATAWSSDAAGPRWLRVAFGKPTQTVRWVVRSAAGPGTVPEDYLVTYTLQRSSDGDSWNDVDRVQGNTRPVTDRRVAQFTARFVRVIVEKPNRHPNGDHALRLAEFELYGAPLLNDPVTDYFAPLTAAPVPDLVGDDLGLGAEETSGSTMVNDATGLFSVWSAGTHIGQATDACRFLRRSLGATGQMMIRVESASGQAGLMLREGERPEARMIYFGLEPGGGLIFGARRVVGAPAAWRREEGFFAPCWLRLERDRSAYAASASKDGITWQQIGTESLLLPLNAEAGFAVARVAAEPSATGKPEPPAAQVEVITFGRTQ